ncbi:MAG TPA: hypothetical protein VEA81_15090 [Burkholderiaceae bacterium]|nr:hypothetical protein [Burkholderiaceae bacterium]
MPRSPKSPVTAESRKSPSARTQPRGRPPRKVFINVLVRASTREALAKIKSRGDLRSQGEVIDRLVMQALGQTGS